MDVSHVVSADLLKYKVCTHGLIITHYLARYLVLTGCLRGNGCSRKLRINSESGATGVSHRQTTDSVKKNNNPEGFDKWLPGKCLRRRHRCLFVFFNSTVTITQLHQPTFLQKKLHHGVSKLKATTNKIQETMRIFFQDETNKMYLK